MKLITRFELASRGESELYALRRAIHDELARSDPGTAERRAALASLDNIEVEIRARALKRRAPRRSAEATARRWQHPRETRFDQKSANCRASSCAKRSACCDQNPFLIFSGN